jgi:hypothetical protein
MEVVISFLRMTLPSQVPPPKVGLCRTLGFEQSDEAKDILERLIPGVVVIENLWDYRDKSELLRISSTSNVFRLCHEPYVGFTITLFCLQQMIAKNLNPLHFPLKPRPLVNIHLYGKTFGLVCPGENYDRMETLILLMGGNIKGNPRADFVIGDEFGNVTSGAKVVPSSWIEALYRSQTYFTPEEHKVSYELLYGKPKKPRGKQPRLFGIRQYIPYGGRLPGLRIVKPSTTSVLPAEAEGELPPSVESS